MRDVALAEACVAYPFSVKSVSTMDMPMVTKAIKSSLQYIARCFEAGQSAHPGIEKMLDHLDQNSRFTEYPEFAACLFFDNKVKFRLLSLLLTSCQNKLPQFEFSNEADVETRRKVLNNWLKQLLAWPSKRYSIVAVKNKTRKHKIWMMSLMRKFAAQKHLITAESVLQVVAKELERKYDFLEASKEYHLDPDAWIPPGDIASLATAAKGAAILLKLMAKSPLETLSTEQLSLCLSTLMEANANPVDVCEGVWSATVVRTWEASRISHDSLQPSHITPFGLSGEFSNPYARLETHKEGFWARVSYLFLHKFTSVAKKVESIWQLPHERQEIKDVLEIASAVNACVRQAYEELSSFERPLNGIQFESIFDIIPAFTLLKTHMATIPLDASLSNPSAPTRLEGDREVLKYLRQVTESEAGGVEGTITFSPPTPPPPVSSHDVNRARILKQIKAILLHMTKCLETNCPLIPASTAPPSVVFEGTSPVASDQVWYNCFFGRPVDEGKFPLLFLLLSKWNGNLPPINLDLQAARRRILPKVLDKVISGTLCPLSCGSVSEEREVFLHDFFRQVKDLRDVNPFSVLLTLKRHLEWRLWTQELKTPNPPMQDVLKGAAKLVNCLATGPLERLSSRILERCRDSLTQICEPSLLFDRVWDTIRGRGSSNAAVISWAEVCCRFCDEHSELLKDAEVALQSSKTDVELVRRVVRGLISAVESRSPSSTRDLTDLMPIMTLCTLHLKDIMSERSSHIRQEHPGTSNALFTTTEAANWI
eukprot:Blabericola_migrator_1__9848@NODE_541_length_7734_cov_36_065475_g375_i2_p2_GENE_NODE_541_length_7734_cov_36_065475_g375_i2NODE_541_length_7734_cov_36_065475_g375_i2_p2_ORF_typecomplete_len767_score105_87Helo_like_N/PF17111_5/87Helo_like_N/PF17111_5/1_2PX/PF00787_24/0_24PX/PF00787_24/4_9e03_NODE_541_length_7734_cov_36_065475_g375_i252267526